MAREIDIVCASEPAQVVAEKLAEVARNGGNVVVTGGGSVAEAYRRAAALEPDWSKVDVWFSDERCVPQDDENSNYRAVKDALLDHISGARVHRMRGELGKEQGSTLYEQELGSL